VILCDVSVLLGAMVERSPHHTVCRGALERLRSHPREMALSELILAAVVRIGSNPRVFRPTPTPNEVFLYVEALTSQAEVHRIEPGPRHWAIFRRLVLETGICGSDTTDAYLAALAMEHDCEWWTTDGGFSRFPGLRWRNLTSG
jgi:toxin-antitoxin system PIN domain toxin